MRPRHIDERTVLLGNIRQKKPSLDRWMKRIGVQSRLRVGGRLAGMREDRLDIDERLEHVRSDVAYEAEPFRAFDEGTQGWHAGQGMMVHGDAPGHCVALELVPHR